MDDAFAHFSSVPQVCPSDRRAIQMPVCHIVTALIAGCRLKLVRFWDTSVSFKIRDSWQLCSDSAIATVVAANVSCVSIQTTLLKKKKLNHKKIKLFTYSTINAAIPFAV